MQTITRDELKKRMDQDDDVVVVEVLDGEQFGNFHLPGAINVPVESENFEQTFEQKVPDKSRPVVVYCMDDECEASPKAARKLERLGYENVYDYEGGKLDWKQAGLPIET